MAGRKGQNSDKGQRGGCCCSHREIVWGPGTARVNSRLTYAQETEDHTAELPEAHGGSGSGGCSGCVCGVGWGVGGLWPPRPWLAVLSVTSVSLSVSPVPRDVSSSPFHALYRF